MRKKVCPHDRLDQSPHTGDPATCHVLYLQWMTLLNQFYIYINMCDFPFT